MLRMSAKSLLLDRFDEVVTRVVVLNLEITCSEARAGGRVVSGKYTYDVSLTAQVHDGPVGGITFEL